MQKWHFWEFGNYFSKEKALIKSEPLDLDGWLGYKIPKGYFGLLIWSVGFEMDGGDLK